MINYENPVFAFNFNNFNNMVLTMNSSKIILFNLNNLDESIKITGKIILIKILLLFMETLMFYLLLILKV